MERKCYGKINLSLDSLYKRDDGYHEIDTIMTRISLFDKLKILMKLKLKPIAKFYQKKILKII